jgi:predicted HTH domain antitoxin
MLDQHMATTAPRREQLHKRRLESVIELFAAGDPALGRAAELLELELAKRAELAELEPRRAVVPICAL